MSSNSRVLRLASLLVLASSPAFAQGGTAAKPDTTSPVSVLSASAPLITSQNGMAVSTTESTKPIT